MEREQKQALIEEIQKLSWNRRGRLKELGIPPATYYRWKKKGGIMEQETKSPRRVWNRLLEGEEETILTAARSHPELSCRLLATKLTDEAPYSVSESTVYRILKKYDLVEPRPLPELPAAGQWRHQTQGPDQIWQCDATHYFVVDWGYYKQISVQDDYSRYILSWILKPDETAYSISEAVEQALENSRSLGHLQSQQMPRLLSDNGAGFVAEVLSNYLAAHGIRHIFGKPYHPQTQGKIERFHRRIKERVCLLVYCSPEELSRALNQAVTVYNHTPHKSLKNVSPYDVYLGRKEEILRKRREKKLLTFELRKRYNLGRINWSRYRPLGLYV